MSKVDVEQGYDLLADGYTLVGCVMVEFGFENELLLENRHDFTRLYSFGDEFGEKSGGDQREF